MILSIVILFIVGGIAYFHYVQGFFSATLSAVCAIFAAVLAFGYHETVVESLLAGKVADYAHGMVLVGLFALIYTILRVVFDAFVPGNVRMPVLLDKIGAGAMGVVAGLFCGGIFAIAAQLLPFGPSIAGYSRLSTGADRSVTVNVGTRAQASDLYIHDELLDDEIDPFKASSLLIPADNLVVGLTNKLSRGGSLAGARPLSSVHPDYLLEAFAQRLGVQAGAKRVAYNLPGKEQISVTNLYRLNEVSMIDSELPGLRKEPHPPSLLKIRDQDKFLLIVRISVDASAADEQDRRFRFSLGSVRLCDGVNNIWPRGTLEDGGVLFKSRPDDFLIKPPNKQMIDLVFDADASLLRDPGALRGGVPEIKDGVFVEVKRMGRVDLSGRRIEGAPPVNPAVGLQWKKLVLDAKPAPPGAPARAAVDAAAAPADVRKAEVSANLFTKINVGMGDADVPSVTFPSGTASLKGRKFTKLRVDASQSIQLLSAGEYTVQELAAPEGRKIVQVQLVPKAADPWAWSDLTKFELDDSAGGKHKPLGAFVKLKQGTSDRMLAAFDVERGAEAIDQVEGRPLEVYLAFGVPSGVSLTGLKFNGKVISSLDTQVP